MSWMLTENPQTLTVLDSNKEVSAFGQSAVTGESMGFSLNKDQTF